MGDRSFADSDPYGVQSLQKKLLDDKNDQNANAKHAEQLRGKLEHIIERVDSPPDRIIAHIKVYTETRPELVKHDPLCIQLLKDLLKCCRLAIKKTVMGQLRDSSSPLAVLVAKTLYTVYQDEPHWPLDLLELYMDDVLGQRQWIDSPETNILVRNLLCWTTPTERNIDSTITSSLIQTSESRTVTSSLIIDDETSTDIVGYPKSDPIDVSEDPYSLYRSSDEESSGDEEVLEESSCRPADSVVEHQTLPAMKPIPDVSDRFSLTRDAAKVIVISLLTQKSGHGTSRQQGQGNTSTSTVVIAMSSFCGLAEIRELSSNCLERWLGNPAIVDCVKILLSRMAECLEVACEGDRGTPIDEFTSTYSNHDYRTLIQSDLGVVREIVKLRYRLKASQLEFYKNTLILIAMKGMPVAKLIMRCMITADLHSGSSTVRVETVKLLLAILNAQQTLPVDTSGGGARSASSSSSALEPLGGSKQSSISRLIGETLGELCYSALTNNSLDDDGTREGEGATLLSVTPGSWTPASSRLLLDLLLRVVRSVEGAKDLDYSAVLLGILGSPSALTEASIAHRSNLERPADTTENRTGQRGSKVHLLEWEIMTFFSDVAIALQLAIASEILTQEKTYKEKQQMASSTSASVTTTAHGAGNASSSSNPGGNSSSLHGLKESPLVVPSVGSGSGGIASAGRGTRGRGGGRGSSIASAHSSMFRGSAMRASAAGTMGSRGLGKQLGGGTAAQHAAVSTVLTASSDSAEGAPTAAKVSSEELEERFHISRDAQWNKMLRLQEVACEWVSDLSTTFDRQGSASEKLSLGKATTSASVDEEPGEVASGSGGSDTDMAALWLEWVQKACCLNHLRVTKVQLDFDKNAPYHVRDNGVVSTALLRAVLRLLLKTAGSTSHLMLGLSLLEGMVHRAVKRAGSKESTGILVTDVEIVRELFELCLVVPVPTGSRARKAPLLPSLAIKALYWRVCALCFTLGCARPESLGLYLWTAYPPVKSLMLMAISSRYSSSAESLAEEYVGTKETEAALRVRVSGTSGVGKVSLDVLKHLDSNGVELYITADHLEARYGRVQDVEAALSRLEEALGDYLFREVPIPVSASAVETEVEGSVGVNGKRTRSVAIDDLVAIHEERERQGQKREVERGARAERAAARLQRDAVSPALDSTRASGSSESDSRSSGIEALLMLAGASSSLGEDAVTVSTERSATSGSGIGDSGVDVSASVEPEPLSSLLKKRQRQSVSDPKALDGEATLSSAMTVSVTDSMDAPSDSLLRSEDTAVVVKEVSLARFVIPKLSSKSAPPFSTVRGLVDAGDIMILRCEGVSRVPSEEVIKTVRALSVRFGFGAKLRGCTEPDFITRAISGEEDLGIETSSAAAGGGVRGEDDSTPRKPVAADVIDLTAEPDRSSSGAAPSSSAAVLRVSRPAVEASFSWLVPAISEDADAILKRIPTAACLHLLLLGTLKTFTRLNMFGIWDQDPSLGDSFSLSTPPSSNSARTGGSMMLPEVTKANVLYFESSCDLQLSLFEGSEHASDVKFLTALAVKVKQHFPSSSSSESTSCGTQRKEQRGLLKVLLSDLQSCHQDRRATARFVLSFLGDSQGRKGPKCLGNSMPTAGPEISTNVETETAWAVHDQAAANPSDYAVGDVARSVARRGRSAGESGVPEAIQQSFAVGPSLVDFTPFLASACAISAPDSPGRAASASDPPIPSPFKRQVTEALLAAVGQETECSVLHQLLRLAHSLTPPSPSAPARVTAAGMLLNLYVTRRLTADLFLSSLLQKGGAAFFNELLVTDMNRIRTFSSRQDDDVIFVEGVDIILTRKGAKKDATIFMSADVLRLLLGIACLIVRDCSDLQAVSSDSGNSDMMECASCILSCASLKDCKKHFLPLLSEALSSMSCPLNLSDDHPSAPLYCPLITAMAPSTLLDLLATAGNAGTGAGAGASTVVLVSSGFPVECLRLIVDTLDAAVSAAASSLPGATARERWQLLAKQFSAKKTEKIQCELQPLVLSVIASVAACKQQTSDGMEIEENGVSYSVKSAESQRSWALNSVSLSNLFTLAELQSHSNPAPAPAPSAVIDLTQDSAGSDVCEVLMDCEDSAESIDHPTSLPAAPVSASSEETLSVTHETDPGSASERALQLFGCGVTFTALQLCCDAITGIEKEEASSATEARGEDEGERAHDSDRGGGRGRGGRVDRGVLSWSLGLLQSSFALSEHVCSTAIRCVSSALLSSHNEETLFALSLTGACDAEAADDSKGPQTKGGMSSGRRWCIFALMLTPLLSREKEQALGAFQRGLAVLKILTLGTGGADGSVLFLLLRQLLSLLAEDLFHRSGGQLVDSLHMNEGRDRRINHLQKNSKASRRIISKLLPSIADFVSILNPVADHAAKVRAEDEDPEFWDSARLQGHSFYECGAEIDSAVRGDSSCAVAAPGAGVDAGAELHMDCLTGREMMRRESQRFLDLIVLSEEGSSRTWSHLTFYPHTSSMK